MTMFHREESYEPGQYVHYVDARPGNKLDPVVEVVENLGTIEIPCGKVDCRSNCLEYIVRSKPRGGTRYNLAECKIEPLVNIL